LVCFDIEHGEWQTLDRFDGLAGLELRAVAGCRGIIFVGGDRGLNRVKTPTGPIWNSGFKAADELVTSEILVKDDTIWAAGVQGIVQLPAAAVGEQEIEGCFFDREPAKCLEIKEDFVWIGTTYGIKIFNRKSREWSELSRDIYLNRGNTLDLEANDSLLFIGTDKGLFRYNYRRNRWQEYGLREGLPHLRVQRLVLEADTLWIGTPVGLTRFIWNRPDRDVD
jgi:ligand-binding sensor domain-containing protein